MKKTACALAFLLAFAGPAAAEEAPELNPGLAKSLQANRSLLRKYQNEYVQLKGSLAPDPAESDLRRLKDLEDKIRVLEEDSEELQSFLPLGRQAEAFVTDLMTKKARGERIKQVRSATDLLQEAELKHAMPASSAKAEDSTRMHERALKYVTEGRFRDAVQLYEEIVMKEPEDDEAYLIMGHTYLLMGQYQKSERAFQNAVHIDPANIGEIVPFYENTILQNPDSAPAYANLGYAYLMVGDVLRAKNAFVESLRIDPENAAAQNGLLYLERLIQ